MSTGFLVGLALVVLGMASARFLAAALPLRRGAVRITISQFVLASVGMAGLMSHCAAMFYPSVIEALPGTDTVISAIDALGTASLILYVVPAVLLLLGLRRQHPLPWAAVALSLIAVGVTMYNGGSLQAHLTAIFVFVVLLAGDAAVLIQLPGRHSQAGPPSGR